MLWEGSKNHHFFFVLFEEFISSITSTEISSSYTFSSLSILPIVYLNADTQKESIVEENRNKNGAYRRVGDINGNSYIGSSVKLSNRFLDYFNTNHLLSHKNMTINRALLKYGYSSFSLIILEYCDPKNCIKREQYYIDEYKPEYNILKYVGSMRGFQHSEETLVKLRNRKVSEEVRVLLSEIKKGEKKIQCSGEQG